MLLQKDKTTINELSRRFEVSRRTISRDIEDICAAGIPIVTTQGYGGGITIADGYRIDKTFFTKEELLMVFAGLKGLNSVSQTLQAQNLMEKLSHENIHMTEEDDLFCINLASHYEDTIPQKIEELKQAVKSRFIVEFWYISSTGEGARRAEPYFLVFQWSSWYLYAYCLEREDYRMFKLNRLLNLKVTDEHYEWRESARRQDDFSSYFKAQNLHLKAVFQPQAKLRLIEEYGIDSFLVGGQGELILERDFVNYSYMCQWVLSFGDQVMVLEPDRLKEDIVAQAKRVVARSGGD